MSETPLLEVSGLTKHFPIRGGVIQQRVGAVRAVNDVSFAIKKGEVFGLAGESGSGKSTIARMVVGLYRPTAGTVHFDGSDVSGLIGSRDYRKQVQMVFQNPGSSLNPRRTIAQSVAVPLIFHDYPKAKIADRVAELLEMVELPRSFAIRYPHELSGGQKQRVAIARALAVEPRLIVLDEPTSALDVSVQAKIIDLLAGLAGELGLTFLFISHDLSLMRNFCSRVGILYLGRLAETGPTVDVFGSPAHPYTQALIGAVPVVSDEEAALKPSIPALSGEIPSPSRIPKGCSFHTRCPFAFEPCRQTDPVFTVVGQGHEARCHLLEERTASAATVPVSPVERSAHP
ncbi:MAG: ABC transporter ATP-binding protein [Pseudomonadota bacterium]